MTVLQVVITEPAKHDLQTIIVYISKNLQNTLAAKTLLEKNFLRCTRPKNIAKPFSFS